MTILYYLILLTVIICIHEGGHLMAAKYFHVYCFEYSLGMGPVIFKKKGKETVFSIRAIPVGGFVSMAGEPDGDEAYPGVVVPAGRRIQEQAPWKRIIIMLAGVAMNFLLAWVLFSLIILNNGAYVQSPKPVVDSVVADTPAEQAGFRPGDLIIKIENADGASVKPVTYTDMQMFVAQYSKEELTYTVKRGDETIKIAVTPVYDEETDSYRIGITGPEADVISINALNCWKYGIVEMAMIMNLMLSTILQLIGGHGLNQLSGPVGVYNATEQYVSMGLMSYLFLIAELSLNVGFFNLLPLPVLDGGQVVTVLVEGIAGHSLNARVKTVIMAVCWLFLIGIMVFATWNDLSRLLG